MKELVKGVASHPIHPPGSAPEIPLASIVELTVLIKGGILISVAVQFMYLEKCGITTWESLIIIIKQGGVLISGHRGILLWSKNHYKYTYHKIILDASIVMHAAYVHVHEPIDCTSRPKPANTASPS